MANFCDLPKPVREAIYRLHLVQDGPVSYNTHEKLTKADPRTAEKYTRKWTPAVCQVSDQADREAAQIYYGENHFVFGRTREGDDSSVIAFAFRTLPRHLRLIRKVTYQWPKPNSWYGSGGGMAGEGFTEIARFKGLQELYIRVDEEAMIRKMLVSRRSVQVSPPRTLTPQDAISILRHPGMSGLLKISGVPHVEFQKWLKLSGLETGGSMPGGFLESEILPKLKATKRKAVPRHSRGTFDFISLMAELRNRVYGLILKLDGPVHPSTQPPSSVPKRRNPPRDQMGPGSALNILAVNRQIHGEAYGIFYDTNTFEFYYPVQLQAFVLGLSPDRLRLVRNVEVHYHNIKSGGVNLADLSFPMLKQLSGLRRLRVLFVNGGLQARLYVRSWYHTGRYGLKNANPLTLPGLKALFDLRGITDIMIRDINFESSVESIKRDKRYPDGFAADSHEKTKLDFERVLDHVNAVLAAAQEGKHNKELLEDDEWHTRDVFPPIEEEIEEVTEELDDLETQAETAASRKDRMGGEMANLMAGQMEEEIAVSSKRGGSTRYGLRRRTEEMEVPAEEDEDDETEAHATSGTAPGDSDNAAAETKRQAADETEQRAEEDEADEMEADGTTAEEEDENEIVVTHVERIKHPKVARAKGAMSGVMLGGFDGASDEVDGSNGDKAEVGEMGDEDEDEDEDGSYFAREPSVEL